MISSSRRLLAPAALLAALLFTACSEAPAPVAATRPAGVLVGTALATTQPLVRTYTLDADVVNLATADIAAQVAGRVLAVVVKPGQPVDGGDELLVLDATDLELARADIQAQLAQSEVRLAQARRELARTRELVKKDYVARAELETAQAAVAALEREKAGFEARVGRADIDFLRARIVAPAKGVVSRVNVAAGDHVRGGDAVLTLWSDVASTVRIRVPQELAGRLSVGQPVSLQWQGQHHESVLERIGFDIDAASRSFDAYARVPAGLRQATGAALRASFEVGEGAALVVPAMAVQLAGDTAHVFVVRDGKATKVAVKPGKQVGERQAIVEGLATGDAVIVRGAAFVRDGQAVRVESEGASS